MAGITKGFFTIPMNLSIINRDLLTRGPFTIAVRNGRHNKGIAMMEKNAKIYVAGHRGMVGSAIVKELKRQNYTNILTRTHKELDLCRQDDVERFFAKEKPEYVSRGDPGEPICFG